MTVGCPGRARSPRRRIGLSPRPLSAILCTLALALLPPPFAQENPSPLEYQVRAAFLFNFAKFVEWPSDPGRGPEDVFLICVVEDDSFAQALDQVVGGKTVEGRVLLVRRPRNLEETRTCRMLYLGASVTPRLPDLLKFVGTKAILTVGSARGFTRQGGIINFVLEDNRVRFEINPDAAERAGLRISSKLLQLATIVRDAATVEDER